MCDSTRVATGPKRSQVAPSPVDAPDPDAAAELSLRTTSASVARPKRRVAGNGEQQPTRRIRAPRLQSLAAVVYAQAPSGSVWQRALAAQRGILRNALASATTAWLLVYACSLGTLSSQPVAQQPYARFLTATLVWSHFFFCLTVFLAQACFLARRRFVSCPHATPTVRFCLQKLYMRTYCAYAGSLALLLASTILVAQYTPAHMRHLRLEFYAACISSHAYTTAAILSMRRIVATQTVGGGSGSSNARRRRGTEPHTANDWRTATRQFIAVFGAYSGLILTVVAAALFVHAVGSVRITTQSDVLALTAASTALKLLVQQCVKLYVIQRNVRDIRTMCVAVGLPTVLIDTQLRLVLQRVPSTQLTVRAVALLAMLEVAMRIGKLVLVTLEIWWESKKMTDQQPLARGPRISFALAPKAVAAVVPRGPDTQSERSDTASSLSRVQRASSTTATTHFRSWKKKLLAFHTAEIYADMSAEYIAIGCSTAILGLYWSHPKYELRLGNQLSPLIASSSSSSSSPAPSTTSAAASSMPGNQLLVIGVQVGTEIAVDYLASAIEIRSGIDFNALRKFDPFVACVYISVAVVNAFMSAVMYMRTGV